MVFYETWDPETIMNFGTVMGMLLIGGMTLLFLWMYDRGKKTQPERDKKKHDEMVAAVKDALKEVKQ